MPEPGERLARLALPEFTRAMRSFASVSSLAAPFHDTLFAPLLAARRDAKAAAGLDAQLRALDGRALEAALVAAVQTVAAECWPKSVADRRALTAQLLDLAAPVLAALRHSAVVAEGVRSASGSAVESPESRGPDWVRALQEVFTAWDGFWAAAAPVVGPLARVKRGRTRGVS